MEAFFWNHGSKIIIMNQIRSSEDIIEIPDWSIPNNNNYQILTMRKAVMTHPSISIALQSENIARMLVSPLSFRKYKASAYDLMYMIQPQKFLSYEPVSKNDNNERKLFVPVDDYE